MKRIAITLVLTTVACGGDSTDDASTTDESSGATEGEAGDGDGDGDGDGGTGAVSVPAMQLELLANPGEGLAGTYHMFAEEIGEIGEGANHR